MDLLSQQVLARAALSKDQHRRVCRRHTLGHFEGASRDVQPVVDPKTPAGAMRGPIASGDQPSPKAPSAPPAKPLPSLEPLLLVATTL